MFLPDGTLAALTHFMLLGISCLSFCNIFSRSSAELSGIRCCVTSDPAMVGVFPHTMCCFPKGYLSKVLRNYTEHACDGEHFSVRCPPHTSISIQSAFYGRNVSSQPPCHHRAHRWDQDAHCHVSTSLQKMLDECQDRRSCQVLVNSRLFGTDPCPSRSKYLTVSYKCRPNEYKSKVSCEGERMRLSCRRGALVAVNSATFGRSQQGTLECPSHNWRTLAIDCQAKGALAVLTSHCQGRRSCSIQASTSTFGDPCDAGTRKYLSVIYTCVPKQLLQEALPIQPDEPPHRTHDADVVGDGTTPGGGTHVSADSQPGKKKRERESSVFSAKAETSPDSIDEQTTRKLKPSMDATPVSTEMALISNALAAYTYVTEHPERAALYFMCGVCLGLALTLLALVIQISCRADCRNQAPKKRTRPALNDSDTSDSDSDWDTSSDLSARRHRRFERTLHTNVFTSAEELERAQRLEERERIIREIWMNGQPDIPGTRSLNRYY